MKVLVISHNVFSKSDNMGRTLYDMFESWNADDIAQLYVHSEVPNTDVCNEYYRVTDVDMVKSIFTRKSGTVLNENDIEITKESSRTDEGMLGDIYQAGRKRTPLIYMMRNLVWRLGAWNTKKLKNWLDEVNPDVIFFISGDYSFLYRIALKIAESRGIPLVVSCMDDFYLNNINEGAFLGGISFRMFMKQAKKALNYASAITCISDKMSQDYSELFKKKTYTLHKPASAIKALGEPLNRDMVYVGNISNHRHEQLINIGRALQKLKLDNMPDAVTVYSKEKNSEILKAMENEPGIRYMGGISKDEADKIVSECYAAIHTESFDEYYREKVKYSVSTKISDSLGSGACIFAYGPEEVASISYLKDNDAAIVVNSEEKLEGALRELYSDRERRNEILLNARNLAKKNHDIEKNKEYIYNVFSECIKERQ